MRLVINAGKKYRNQFTQWLNAIIILLVVVVMVDTNLSGYRHKDNSQPSFKEEAGISALLLLALLIWNITYNKKLKSTKNKSNGIVNKRHY